MRGRSIVAIGRAADLDVHGALDYGDAVILPGFVNAHTHLELTSLAGCVPPGPSLAEWLGRLVDRLRARGDAAAEATEDAVREGIRQSLAAGVTAVGDITAMPRRTRPILAGSPLAGVSYGEVIAIGSRRAMLLARLEAAVEAHTERPDFHIGLSPHSTYTVEPGALYSCAAATRARRMPICVHAAESPEEEAFTRRAAGPLADHLRALGLWDDGVTASEKTPVELLAATGLLTPETVLAHGNYLEQEDIDRIAASGSSVAYCPRTHAGFGHAPHPLPQLRAAGVNVCIGTDSLASNPDLSILGELRFLKARHPEFAPMTLLEMGTHAGARALGLDHRIGRLAPGCRADLVVVPLDGTTPPRWCGIFESQTAPIVVCAAGQWITNGEFKATPWPR
jgi:cytosine/adenosine deaminase-related metal-dependent hydrolase